MNLQRLRETLGPPFGVWAYTYRGTMSGGTNTRNGKGGNGKGNRSTWQIAASEELVVDEKIGS